MGRRIEFQESELRPNGRVVNWETKLSEFVQSKSDTPFEWGQHDCASFAMKAIEVLTLEYPIDIEWDSAFKAKKLLNQQSLIERADDIWTPVDVSLCKRGDLVATMTLDGEALGIFLSPTAAFASEVGLAYRGRHELIKAWSI
jgi:hypothetical protein